MNNQQIPKKSLGQHWLYDQTSLRAMADGAAVGSGDTVLEIGPGTGSLTEVLLQRGARVVAVEKDDGLAVELQQQFKDLPFSLNLLSILDFDFHSMPADYKIVANIPYYLTNHLLRLLSETQHKPIMAALLVQKEVAERVTAQPGELSVLGVIMQFYYEVSRGKVVPAHLFTPPPKVDSQILVLKARTEPLFTDIDTKSFFRLIKAGFANRRKNLSNSLAGGLSIDKAEATKLLQQAGINPNERAQALSLNDWHDLYRTFNVAISAI